MIFGFGKKKAVEEEVEEREIELILFQGALNGKQTNLQANARLVEAGLLPAKELVTDAISRRAHTMRLDPKGDRTIVGLLVDGIPVPGTRLSKQQGAAVTQMLKLLAGLDIKNRTRPQSGGINAEYDETPYELLVQSTPVSGGGERLTVHMQNLKQLIQTPDDFGMTEELKTKIRELTSQKSGVVLVCGPPRSGTTTTLYVTLRAIDAYLYQIYSMADVGNRELVNIASFEGEPGDDLATTLERCIRVEADVILVDPIRDAKAAQACFSVHNKVCVLAEFAAKDAVSGIGQVVEWLGNPQLAAQGLQGIISQRLIRMLCTECREAYRPNPKILAKMGLPPETRVLYRPPKMPQVSDRGEELPPCPRCEGVGYLGRTAIVEVIEMTDAMKQLVAKGAPAANLKAQARKEKMQTLQRDGLRLVAEGRTSLEELQRLFKGG